MRIFPVGLFHYVVTDYLFQNALAETFFNAQVDAGFDEAEMVALYGVNRNEYAEIVDTEFVSIGDVILGQFWAYLPCQGGFAEAALINAVNPGTFDGIAVGSPTFGKAVTFNGTTQYVRSQLNMAATLSATAHGVGVWALTNPDQTAYLVGGRTSGGGTNNTLGILSRTDTDRLEGYSRGIVALGNTGSFPRTGLLSAERLTAANLKLFDDTTEIGSSTTSPSQALGSTELFYACNNVADGVGAQFFWQGECALHYVSKGLTQAQLATVRAARLTTLQNLGIV